MKKKNRKTDTFVRPFNLKIMSYETTMEET